MIMCHATGRADIPLSPRHSWRSMDISMNRSPKLPHPCNSAMPSGRSRDMEDLEVFGSLFCPRKLASHTPPGGHAPLLPPSPAPASSRESPCPLPHHPSSLCGPLSQFLLTGSSSGCPSCPSVACWTPPPFARWHGPAAGSQMLTVRQPGPRGSVPCLLDGEPK